MASAGAGGRDGGASVGFFATSDAAIRKQCLKVVRQCELSADDHLSVNKLHLVLEKVGIVLSAREFSKVVAEAVTDADKRVTFEEFVELTKRLLPSQALAKARNSRVSRQYMTPEVYDKWREVFRNRTAGHGMMNAKDLDSFFKERRVSVPTDKLQAIISEVDTDGSGELDESEFLSLMIRAANMKKRKVGPGLCPLSTLLDEGWTLPDLKKVGYEVNEFAQDPRCSVDGLLDIFSAAELRLSGKTLQELLAAGWEARDARTSGFSQQDLLQAGCGMRKLRLAGWDDVPSVVQLRKLGVEVEKLRLAGWKLSELRAAGYSTGALRAGGYSAEAVAAQQRIAARNEAAKAEDAGAQPLTRRTTMQLIAEAEGRLAKREPEAQKPAEGDAEARAAANG